MGVEVAEKQGHFVEMCEPRVAVLDKGRCSGKDMDT